MSGRSLSQSLRVHIGGAFAALVLRVLHASLRWNYIPRDTGNALWESGEQKLIAFWHGRILLVPLNKVRAALAPQRPIHCLISEHRDGQIISRAAKIFGVETVVGSSTRGGLRGLYEMVVRATEGSHLAITPDGPRGPRHECKNGVALIAKRTGLPVYPIAFSAKRFWQAKSWDGMIVPKPFSPAIMLVGDPIQIGPDDPVEVARLRIEEQLNAVTAKAEAYWKVPDLKDTGATA
jgi:lysophospholipid acyltransferase (LPLAT)-like uncharacterized protein